MKRRADSDRWAGALLTLPDDAFFSIMRNYFGELKTPFNKHALVDELLTFISRSDTQERVLANIDESDARLLTAIDVLNEPEIAVLAAYFAGTVGALEQHHHLVNLEERLLIFRERVRNATRVRVNPHFRDIVDSVVAPHVLFPSRPAKVRGAGTPWLNDTFLLCLLSYFATPRNAVKLDGSLKRRAAEEMSALFAATGADAEQRLGAAVGALELLGLLRRDGAVMTARVGAWRSFAALDDRSRAALALTAALIVRAGSDRGEEDERAARPSDLAETVADLIDALEPDRAYPGESIERMLVAAAAESETSRQALGGPVHRSIVSGLAFFGVIEAARDSSENEYVRSGPGPAAANHGGRGIVVEPNFAVTVTPSLSIAAGIDVALMAELRKMDVYSQFEITKHSFHRALESGATADGATLTLETISGAAVPQNVRFSLASWEQEFHAVTLVAGVVLTADRERRHLIEHSESVQPFIRARLADGVYLLDPREQPQWEEALRRTGIDPLPPVASLSTAAGGDSHGAFIALPRRAPLRQFRGPAAQPSATGNGTKPRPSPTRLGAAELYAHLETLVLSDEDREDMKARINKGLILFASQLEHPVPRAERFEAKGLDYVGKVRLIEQALLGGSDLLEILEREAKGSARRILVKPLELERSGNELLLSATLLPEERPVRVRVSKIGLVRKLKSSLYAP